MRRPNTLAVDRMTTRQLWDRLEADLIDGEMALLMMAPPKVGRPAITEARRIVRELRLRGVQTQMGLDS